MSLVLLTSAQTTAKGKVDVPERSTIDSKYLWKVEDLYPSLQAWRDAKEALVARFGQVEACRGKLGDPGELNRCLTLVFDVAKELYRLDSYANRVADQDTRKAEGAALRGEIQRIESKFSEITAFVEPELLSMSEAELAALAADERNATFRHYLDNVNRRRPHTLSKEEEALLAQASLLGRGPENVYDIFTGSDLKFGKMVDSKGQEVTISIPMYVRYRSAPNREDRKKIFEGFWKVYRDYQNTFATLLATQVNRDIFFARARKYDTTLQAALDPENIPVEVYTTMLDSVRRYIPLLHRYLRLRKKLLGVDELHYYDMYAPLLPSVDMQYSYEDAVKVVSEALAPLGEEYVTQVTAGMSPGSGWVDVYPTKGKRTGAYMSGEAYDVHPFVLLNFDGSYDNVSTLAHEMGHAMHSYLTARHQPFHYADYATFIAEIASTFNESLLMHHVLSKTKDRDKRLYLLGEFMETFRTVVFRQALFAAFELEVHQRAEKGEALTADVFNSVYRKLLDEFYGTKEGVTVIEDRDEVEWAYIPHFYYNFYVYTYVTGLISAVALSEKVLAEGDAAAKPYLRMLSRGSSDYPLTLLEDAGVDMTTSEPYDIAMARFEKVLDEVEALAGK